MTQFRYHWKQHGEHIHIRMFVSQGEQMTGVCCGDLVFRKQEWDDFCATQCGDVVFVEQIT